MEWIEASLFTTNQGIEAVCAMLMESGVEGMEIDDDADMKIFLNNNSEQWDYVDDELLNKENAETCVKFYVSCNAFGNETMLSVKNAIKLIKAMDLGIDLGTLELELKNVDDEDWLNNWKKYYKPFEIGEKIVIKPTWEEYTNPSGKIVFTINPGHVFGTGLHQTTQLCIEQLEKYVSPSSLVCDLGCGTGILSIISLLLGAQSAVALDIDANAVDIAYENALLNNIVRSNYHVSSGNIISDATTLERIMSRPYNLVVANIVADVIIGLSEIVPKLLKDGGVFISSGIISSRLDEVKEALSANGFEVKNILNKDDWFCVVCQYGGM